MERGLTLPGRRPAAVCPRTPQIYQRMLHNLVHSHAVRGDRLGGMHWRQALALLLFAVGPRRA